MKTGSPNPKQRSRGRVLQGGNGNKKHVPLRNQTFDSNGPDVRIRGNAHQVHEKYLALARDATAQGDRVAAENYFQHAEHYYRIINAHAQQQPVRQPRVEPNDAESAGASEGQEGTDAGEAVVVVDDASAASDDDPETVSDQDGSDDGAESDEADVVENNADQAEKTDEVQQNLF